MAACSLTSSWLPVAGSLVHGSRRVAHTAPRAARPGHRGCLPASQTRSSICCAAAGQPQGGGRADTAHLHVTVAEVLAGGQLVLLAVASAVPAAQPWLPAVRQAAMLSMWCSLTWMLADVHKSIYFQAVRRHESLPPAAQASSSEKEILQLVRCQHRLRISTWFVLGLMLFEIAAGWFPAPMLTPGRQLWLASSGNFLSLMYSAISSFAINELIETFDAVGRAAHDRASQADP